MEFAEKERLSGEQQDCYRDMMEYYSMWAHQIKTPIAAAQLILQSAQQQGGELSPEDLCGAAGGDPQDPAVR